MAGGNDAGGQMAGLESLLGDMNLGDMDLGALMKDLDPAMLQELVMEGLKDPQLQEMVREKIVDTSFIPHSIRCEQFPEIEWVSCSQKLSISCHLSPLFSRIDCNISTLVIVEFNSYQKYKNRLFTKMPSFLEWKEPCMN